MTLFVSYSRQHGRVAATRWRRFLQRHSIRVWHDEVALNPSSDFVEQIRSAITSNDIRCVLLIATPLAFESPFVAWEVGLAISAGKDVILVSGAMTFPPKGPSAHRSTIAASRWYPSGVDVLALFNAVRPSSLANRSFRP